ncbi:MAG: pyridoxal 5'-phosphate synthase glutaminase subunit PdxT [Desulfobacterales bacterium]
MKIGVLALQGAFVEHVRILQNIGVQAAEIRLPREMEDVDGIIIPGGESTTISKLMGLYGFVDPIRAFARTGAVWGTCAGMIVMAKAIYGETPCLSLMDIAVERNAFGRQVDSFEESLEVPELQNGTVRPFPGVFIRAPKLIRAGKGTAIIAKLKNGDAVAALQGRMLVTAFHPELSTDDRFHRFFIELVHNPADYKPEFRLDVVYPS